MDEETGGGEENMVGDYSTKGEGMERYVQFERVGEA